MTDNENDEGSAEQQAIRRLISGLAAVSPPLDLTQSVMRRVRAPDVPRWTAVWRQLVTPRELHLRVRPAWGLAFVAAIGVICGLVLTRHPASHGRPDGPASGVSFVLLAPGAHSVAVAGDFNGWRIDATALEDGDGDGVWRATIGLSPGRYEYMFVIDGERWVTDPRATARRQDGFGNVNAVLEL